MTRAVDIVITRLRHGWTVRRRVNETWHMINPLNNRTITVSITTVMTLLRENKVYITNRGEFDTLHLTNTSFENSIEKPS